MTEVAEIAEVSLGPVERPIRFYSQPIGDVRINMLPKPGEPMCNWVNTNQLPTLKPGEVLVFGFGKYFPLAVYTVGDLGKIEDPGSFEWVANTRRLLDQGDTTLDQLKCEVFRTVR